MKKISDIKNNLLKGNLIHSHQAALVFTRWPLRVLPLFMGWGKLNNNRNIYILMGTSKMVFWGEMLRENFLGYLCIKKTGSESSQVYFSSILLFYSTFQILTMYNYESSWTRGFKLSYTTLNLVQY